ncbi:3726_t:CDS:2, partial [Acaulospora morrowiae]
QVSLAHSPLTLFIRPPMSPPIPLDINWFIAEPINEPTPSVIFDRHCFKTTIVSPILFSRQLLKKPLCFKIGYILVRKKRKKIRPREPRRKEEKNQRMIFSGVTVLTPTFDLRERERNVCRQELIKDVEGNSRYGHARMNAREATLVVQWGMVRGFGQRN